VFLDFLKKKLQDAVGKGAQRSEPGSDGDYEERRKAAQALYDEGKPADAIALLEALAAELAGAGNFPLAVAVRHQIHQWEPELDRRTTPAAEATRMATQHRESGSHKRPSISESSVRRLVQLSPLLEEMTVTEIAGLIESTGLTSYDKGQVVVEEGTPGDKLYIVTRGVLSVSTKGADGNRVRVGTLSVGDFFGEVAVLTGKPRVATVTAQSEAECLQISGAKWADLSTRHPRLKELLEEALKLRAQLAADAVVDDLRKRRSGTVPSVP
jgi:cAMP-dependent protein kinase regulator